MTARAAVAIASVLFTAVRPANPVGAQTSGVPLPAFAEGAGPVVVMLGGGTFGAAEFASHAHVLSRRFRVIRLQTFNVDRAEKRLPLPEGYSLKTESAAIEPALAALGVAEPVDLVGHSFGALVALDFALDHPSRVRTLTLAEPPAFWAVAPQEREATRDMKTMYELSRELGPAIEPTDDQLVRFMCVLGTCGARRPDPAEPGWSDWVARRSALRGLSAVALHVDDPRRLNAFSKPVLVVTGASTVSFHRRIDDILLARLPAAERLDLPGGHGAVASARDEFVAALTAFIDKHRAS